MAVTKEIKLQHPNVYNSKLPKPDLLEEDRVRYLEEIRTKLLSPSFPIPKMTALLDHDNHQMRADFRKFISEPVMVPRYNISLEEERELALRRLQRICDNKVKPPFRTFFWFTKILFSSSLSLIFGTTH